MSERPGDLRGYRKLGSSVLVDYGGPTLAISLPHPAIARIRFAPTGALAPRRSWSPVPPDEELAPPHVTVGSDDGTVEISSDVLTVRAEPAGARVTVADRRGGRVLVEDGPEGGPTWKPDGTAMWTRRMPRGQHYFGFGNRTGLLDKRGRMYEFWCTDRFEEQGPGTNELYQAIPFYLAMDPDGHCCGVYLNNTYRSVFDLTDDLHEQQVIRVCGGELDQYVIAGPTPAEVVERYTLLTGRMPLPPRWALGYHHSRWGYSTAEQIRQVAQRLRADAIPTDVIYIDVDHQHEYRVFTWDPGRFPNPAGLVRELQQLGLRAAKVLNVGVKYQPEGGYPVYTEGAELGYFLTEGDGLMLRYVWPGLCAFPDFARTQVRDWWARWYEESIGIGIRVLVNDMNEPSMRDRMPEDPQARRMEPPLDTPHGPPEERTTHAEVHNVYGYLENCAINSAARRALADERYLIVSRAGFAGMQRHSMTWTGDNASYWEHLEMSLPQLQNLGLSGVPFAGADIGGFFADCGPELLARWYQAGAFYPYARNNCSKPCAPQEPWVWGPEIEAVCRRALELRYRLLPYLYTVFEEASRTGAPVLRPLLYHHADDPAARVRDDQALLGRDLLVAPVVRPGRISREVYLPAGRWYHLHSGAVESGPARLIVDAPLDGDAPVYVRGGAVLPLGPVMQWTGERPLDPLWLEVFPDETGVAEGELYEDDGVTRGHERGEWARTRYAYRDGTLTARRDGQFVPPDRTVRIRVHGDTGGHERQLARDDREWTVGTRDD
ncbi:alpha-glucosidase [Micromonospora pattaloongensis]|uniref:Alpha-glucosidase n=1 Tax=Micromonospora pattaloongensis TaxID=405436 RepID=A0A1H3JES0_9ACTN|nr:TIM-barrel domain-containing protein [Micromonospora pattaloongensis]SDY38069.1 alpha-glucosidase [Micromonospora pattaloongensis]